MNRRPVMHPQPAEHVRSLQIALGSLLLVWVLLGGTGCAEPRDTSHQYSPFGPVDTIAADDVPRDSVLSVLTSMNRTAFDSAFVRLDEYALTRHVRTEQLDTAGATTALQTLTLRYQPGTGPGTVLRRDSMGAFQNGGLFSAIAPTQQPRNRPANLAEQALPDQPSYLAARTREAYRYALRTGSLLDGTPTYVIEARAHSDERGRDQGVRFARLTLDRASHELVGLSLVRAERVLLFGEDSQLTVRLRKGPDGAWVPHLARFRAVVSVPIRTPRQFRTVSAYYAYDR